jgi:membrane associated rhomboid family serine protease
MSFFRTEIDKLLGKNASTLTRLIVINIIVFLFANILTHIPGCAFIVNDYLALPATFKGLLFRPWTLFTYMFVHEEPMHIIYNMLWFYWFGIVFVDFMSNKRLLYTYILGGISGGILFLLFSTVTGGIYPLIGASAGIMAVIVATAILVPDYEFNLLFFGRVKIKYLAIAAFLLTSIVDFTSNTGGKVSHIGGAIYGIFYMLQYKKGTDYAEIVSDFFKRIGRLFAFAKAGARIKRKNTMYGVPGGRTKTASADEKQKKIDKILDKISHSGYDALTKEEKDFLFKSSKQQQE